MNKVVYFSDGSAVQYKNGKNFLNLTLNEDFGDHFFATSHDKNACDSLGGTIKRLAARASLKQPYTDQIMTPTQLFQRAETNI
jgi:hypothetical protein